MITSQPPLNETPWSEILSLAPDACAVVTTSGDILGINEAFSNLSGRTDTEIRGLQVADLLPGRTPAEIGDRLEEWHRNGSIRLTHRLRRADGERQHLEVRARALPGSPARLACFVRDVTQRTELEAEQTLVIRLLQTIGASLSLAEVAEDVLDAVRVWADVEFVGLSLEIDGVLHRFGSGTGVDRATLLSVPPCAGAHPMKGAGTECPCRTFAHSGGDGAREGRERGPRIFWTGQAEALRSWRATLPAGCGLAPIIGPNWSSAAIVPVRLDGKWLGQMLLGDTRALRLSTSTAAALERITSYLAIAVARWRDKRSIERSEASYHGLFNTVRLAIYVQDPEGRFVDVNDGAVAMYGYAREEFLGRTPEFLSAPGKNDLPAVGEHIRRAFAGEPQQFEFWGLRRNGEIFPKDVRLYRGIHFGKEVIIAVAADITEAKRMEERLLHTQKMEAIGQLAGGVAHDFNNVLAAMMLQIGLLQMNLENDPASLNEVRELARSTEHAIGLTQQLVLFSRRNPIQREPLDLNALLAELRRMIESLIGETIQLAFEAAPDLPGILGDPNLLRRVILNLCVNARDAMPDGGRLRIATSRVKLDAGPVARHSEARPGEFACLEVVDSGCGMDSETKRRIFEPFFTSKGPGKGTGLGLSISYSIIRQQDGWIDVRSEPGQGSTFRVYLPAIHVTPSRPSAPGQPPPPARRETILLVEDNLALRRSLVSFLGRVGYNILEAVDGPSAMKLWDKHGSEVSLVLTDMVMPAGMSGLDLARSLRARRPDLPVIISSGYSEQLDDPSIARAGIVMLPKPVPPTKLAEAIRRNLDRAPSPAGSAPAPEAAS